MTSIVEVIQHYLRSIDSNHDDELRLLHCINRLYNLPIKVEHLQETGVGRTVNSLRKFNGDIGVAAKTLVTKWKAMVAAEEEPMDTTSQSNENETPNNDDGATPQEDEDDENHNCHNTNREQHVNNSKHNSSNKKSKSDGHKERNGSSVSKETKTSSHSSSSERSAKHLNDKHKTTSSLSSKDKEAHHQNICSSASGSIKDKEKIDHKSSREKHKSRDDKHNKEREHSDKKREDQSKRDKENKTASTSSHHESSGSHSSSSSKSRNDGKHNHSSSKEKGRSEKHKSSSKDRDRSKEKNEHKTASTSTISKSSTKDPEGTERKRRRNSDNDSIEFKTPQPKMRKIQKPSKLESSSPQEDEEADDSFDSSMGTNFNDILGMLDMPKKKSKKSIKSPTTPVSSSSSSNKKEATHHKSENGNSGTGGDKFNGSKTTVTSSLFPTPSTSKRPDLLAPTPSIALELPTISTNYKPLPLNQTVMDCTFNNSANTKPVRTLSDAEAITHGISSKTMRTKVYSGMKTGQTYQVPTLFNMCIRSLQKNIDALKYTGGVPFDVLKPVLERATPQQLYVFEEYNPYLMEDSNVLWQQHVSRSFRTKKRLENESWREMYIRCQEEEERRLSVLKDSIKASQKIAVAPVRKTQLAFVDSMVKPPRNILRKQEQYGTKSKLVATPAARVASLFSVTPNAAKIGDQRLKVPVTARDHTQVSSSSVKRKKAPLMQKTLQFIRGRYKR